MRPFGTPAPVFVSYAHADKNVVLAVMERLGPLFRDTGVESFFDRTDRPTEDADGLAYGLAEPMTVASVFLVFGSGGYMRSKWCRAELDGYARMQRLKCGGLDRFGRSVVPGRIVAIITEASDGLAASIQDVVASAVEPQHLTEVLSTHHIPVHDPAAAAQLIRDAVLRALPRPSPAAPSSFTPAGLWRTFTDLDRWLTDVPIDAWVADFRPPQKFDAELRARIEQHRSTEVIQVLDRILLPWVEIYSRAAARDLSTLIPIGDLAAAARNGQPPNVLVAMLHEQAVRLPEIQYSYYQCLIDGRRHWSIDTAAFAALVIAYDSIMLREPADIREQILAPLENCADLQKLRWGV